MAEPEYKYAVPLSERHSTPRRGPVQFPVTYEMPSIGIPDVSREELGKLVDRAITELNFALAVHNATYPKSIENKQ